jgi:hypothetical protein
MAVVANTEPSALKKPNAEDGGNEDAENREAAENEQLPADPQERIKAFLENQEDKEEGNGCVRKEVSDAAGNAGGNKRAGARPANIDTDSSGSSVCSSSNNNGSAENADDLERSRAAEKASPSSKEPASARLQSRASAACLAKQTSGMQSPISPRPKKSPTNIWSRQLKKITRSSNIVKNWEDLKEEAQQRKTEITEKNLLQYIGVIEQRVSEIRQIFCVVTKQKSSDLKNGKQLKIDTLPTTKLEQEDWSDDEEQEIVRPLSYVELLDHVSKNEC